jgi:hypothetical protein
MRKLDNIEYGILACLVSLGMCITTLIVVYGIDEQSASCQTSISGFEISTWVVVYTIVDVLLLVIVTCVYIWFQTHFRSAQISAYITEGIAWVLLGTSLGLNNDCTATGMWVLGVVQMYIFLLALFLERFAVNFSSKKKEVVVEFSQIV